MTPILTVTLNPALDISTSADHVRPGPKLRCADPRVDPGGGGINVSRVIRRLGGRSTAFIAIGGATGERLAAALVREGLTPSAWPAPGETRESIAVTDRSTGEQYRFVLPGPHWSRKQADAALAAIVTAAPQGAFVVLSGSLPPGMAPDLPLRLARRLKKAGARLILDTSGEALRHAARGSQAVHVLRMDQDEAEDLAGRPLPDRAAGADFARDLVRSGAAEIVIVGRGAEGSVMATRDGAWFAPAAKVPVASKVGAGDSFVAAFTLALARARPLPYALSAGMAAASAAVMTEATELCRPADARRLIASCPARPV